MVDIKLVQNRLLEMGKIIAEIFEKNNIPYMIFYGTLLGAVRHKSFIPWDDDFDFMLFDDTYEEAISSLKRELPKDMFLEYFDTEPKYFHDWAHIKDLKTKAECNHYKQDNIYLHNGLCIDLYKTKKIKESEVERYLLNENKKYFDRRKRAQSIDINEYNLKIEDINRKINNLKICNENSKDVYAFLIPYFKTCEINELLPLKKYEINNVEFYGPNNADAILKKAYNNYMELPPIEKRVSHYSNVIFLNKTEIT